MARPRTRPLSVKTVCLRVSPEAWLRLQEIAKSLGLSRSELVEKVADQDFSISEWKALVHEEKL
ncbi:MAG: hypothetical protein ACKPFA_31435 [Dolichospermum sp.]